MSARISIDCTRPLIISEYETKKREIAKLVGLNRSTVQDIKTKINNYGSPLPHKQTGRPLKINERTERHLNRVIREDPFASYKEINMELAKLDIFVCIETLRSYVDRLDFKSYRAAHKPRLTARHRKSRLRWVKEHLNWTEDQRRSVVWSDETRFCGGGGGGGGAMVWGCFWGGGFGPSEIIDTSSVDQETYIHVLANRFHPWFTNVTAHQERDFIFQEDSASCHTGGYARCPDLSPIEHVWNALERQIERKRSSVKNLEQLKVALREEWERMDDEFADRLVRSMKRRCEAIIKAKGGTTEY
ncbi:hypothetical protein G6F46_005487 [Rhizopus delemar]|uniref:Transposase Tc1-like domain-containing protein n=2 Tax=Rhizopus TaxID=4842 RepID=A0A9P7CM78_9FUNG|nr:hypothetical protein G6F55_008601 [Rhizopus delemar]KAG1538952.1 hypothetical protein G6F51_009448 [Rhizopus arrhizus]KAG1492656.1 hypothetical protein G6F54_009148 [Rhizopus delemar]KAG1506837.1 hypothetical protein G6F53_009398 [Rhizopus delemar]KAG1522102.1 hypothetical protein G6F52_006156 [Rhizopus delemar]